MADPFVASDWPNPPRSDERHSLPRGFVAGMPIGLIGQDQFFGAPGQPPPNMDWPNPRGAPPGPISNRTHIWPLNLGLSFVPFIALDWPNPRGPAYPLSNRGFVYWRPAFLREPPAGPSNPGFSPALIPAAPPSTGLPPAFRAWALRLVDVVNLTLQGKMNVTLPVTLDAGVDETTIIDARIGVFSALMFTPLTASAAAEQAAGTMYISAQKSGQATLSHANNGLTDRQFRMVVLG